MTYHGSTFRLLRDFTDLSQTEMAEEIGVAKTVISDIETCRRQASKNAVDAYCKYFEISRFQLDYLNEALSNEGNLPKPSRMIVKLLKYAASKSQAKKESLNLASNSSARNPIAI